MAKNASMQLNYAEPWEGYGYNVFKAFVQPREEGLLECWTLKVLLQHFRALTSFFCTASEWLCLGMKHRPPTQAEERQLFREPSREKLEQYKTHAGIKEKKKINRFGSKTLNFGFGGLVKG